jgi:hypothetical protein
MIIKGERITSSRSATPLLRHLLHGEENERVALIQGTDEDVRAAFADARDADKKFALRHFIISPLCETTRAEAMMIFGLLAKDFAFDPATGIIFEHDRSRAVATAFGGHWHCLVPEINASGRVMDSQYNFLRHEKVAVLAAHKLGRAKEFVRSNHEAAVLSALESDGCLDAATALRAFIESDSGQAHREAFSRNVQQMGKRQGVDVPAARAAVRAAWETTKGWVEFTSAVDAGGYHVSAGDRDGTLIVETTDGLFIGALHRLARVRKSDLQKRKEAQHERTAETEQRPRDAGSDASRPPDNKVSTSNPGRLSAGATAEGGSHDPVGLLHPDRHARHPDQSGDAPPPAGRRSSPHPGRLTVALRAALIGHPQAARDLLERARLLARAPQERVRAKLGRLDQQLKAELQNLTEPSLLSPELDAAARRLADAKAHERKISDLLDREKKRRERHMSSRPTGVMASIRGDTGAWAAGLAKIDAKLADLEKQSRDAWSRRRDVESVVAELEKSLQRKKRAMRDSAGQQEKLLICQRKTARLVLARQILDKSPLLAFGGLTMLMAAAATAATINSRFSRKVGVVTARTF